MYCKESENAKIKLVDTGHFGEIEKKYKVGKVEIIMIFEVTKDSTLFDKEPVKPMEEANKLEVEGHKGWFIKLDSLEELIALQDKYGTLELTISFKHNHKIINIPDHN